MAYRKLAIIGGGPKAAAICAKAACLAEAADFDLRVTVFEKSALGAAWDGAHGYTDGEQLLCTPAERDFGFPYADTFGEEVAKIMQSRFSWMAFTRGNQRYATWVDRGRPPPNHREFAEYVDATIRTSATQIVLAEAESMEWNRGRWAVNWRHSETGATDRVAGFHGVVFTGPGPARSRLERVDDARIFDGVSFWSRPVEVRDLAARTPDVPVAIVGSGGTAAAIAGWLVRAQVTNRIVILGKQPALYARSDSFFENRMFTSTEIWDSLSDTDRIAFADRLTRGAVWSNVLDELARASNVHYLPGEAGRIRYEPEDNPNGVLAVEFVASRDAATRTQPACLVVDATGFDPVWFSRLLPAGLRPELEVDLNQLRSGMDENLRLNLTMGRSLHAPMLSQVVSPSYTSLMALGRMADAVLEPYVSQLLEA